MGYKPKGGIFIITMEVTGICNMHPMLYWVTSSHLIRHTYGLVARKEGHGVIQFYDGTSWNTQYEVKGDGWISGIEALDPRHIWAVGFGGIYFGEQK